MASQRAKCVILSATSDDTTFREEQGNKAGQLTDYGPDNYAAITWANAPDNKTIMLGWMNHWGYASATPTQGWQGIMTIPREVSLVHSQEGLKLLQKPVESLQTLRTAHFHWHQETVDSETKTLCAQTGEAFEIIAEFHLATAHEFGLQVRKGGREQTIIGFNTSSNVLFIDRTAGRSDFSPHFSAHYEAPLQPKDGKLYLQILVDRCSIEVFGNGGEVLLSALVFPEAKHQELACYAVSGEVILSSFDLYQLDIAGSKEA